MTAKKLRLLIVDHDAADTVLLRKCITAEAWESFPEVDAASTGGEAIDLLARHRYHLMLLDSRLPLGGGPELLQEMKRQGQDVPVLLLGGPGDEKTALEAMKAGAMDYLEKNAITPRSLVSAIRFAVNMRQKEQLRRQAEEALRISERDYRNLFENANDAILICEPRTEIILEANRKACEIYGLPRDQLIGLSLKNFTADGSKGEGQFLQLLSDRVPQSFDRVHFSRDGSRIDLVVSASLVDYRGKLAVLAINRDVTARKRAEQEIQRLAYTDVLTGLSNRVRFEDRLDLALAQAKRDGYPLAVLFLDLDRFKLVNDSLGHRGGDLLLQEVAERLNELIRGGDTLARVGGDEFLLLLYKIERPDNAGAVARKILGLMRQPFLVAGRELYVTTSIGISVYPHDGGDGESLVKNADAAMYRAKQQGRDNYQFYLWAKEESGLDRLSLETALHKAVAGGQLRVHYQPKVSLKSNRITGVEALVRWQHPERGLLLPAEFISLAEETGLIVPLGEWVLKTACSQTHAWQLAGYPDLEVAVNLSARQIREPAIADAVAAVLRQTGLPASRLELEITESVAMENVEATLTTLRRLKQLGVRITMDDFGTGYSSLSYLKRFPIDTLKIDQSFVRDLTTNPNDASIARASIRMSHELKMNVVAEGVETEEQRAFLKRYRCDQFQGFLFSPALPPEDFERLLVRHQRTKRPPR